MEVRLKVEDGKVITGVLLSKCGVDRDIWKPLLYFAHFHILKLLHISILTFLHLQRHTHLQLRQGNDDLKSKYFEAVAHFNFNISPIAQRHTPVQLRPPAVLLSSDFFAGQGCSRAINREVDGIWISPKNNRILYITPYMKREGVSTPPQLFEITIPHRYSRGATIL